MRRRADFLAARKGEKRGGRWFSLEVLDRELPDAPPRLGMTVTKKVGNAVLRNRIRRRLREAVRTEVARDMRPGHDYVIVARAEVARVPFGQLVDTLRERIARAPGDGGSRGGADGRKRRAGAKPNDAPGRSGSRKGEAAGGTDG